MIGLCAAPVGQGVRPCAPANSDRFPFRSAAAGSGATRRRGAADVELIKVI